MIDFEPETCPETEYPARINTGEATAAETGAATATTAEGVCPATQHGKAAAGAR
jgi:hypothetical protein